MSLFCCWTVCSTKPCLFGIFDTFDFSVRLIFLVYSVFLVIQCIWFYLMINVFGKFDIMIMFFMFFVPIFYISVLSIIWYFGWMVCFYFLFIREYDIFGENDIFLGYLVFLIIRCLYFWFIWYSGTYQNTDFEKMYRQP